MLRPPCYNPARSILPTLIRILSRYVLRAPRCPIARVHKFAVACAAISCATILIVRSTSPVAEAQATGCTDQALTLAEGQLTDTLAYTSTSQFPSGTNAANGNK